MLEMIQMIAVVVLCVIGLTYVFVCFSCDGEEK